MPLLKREPEFQPGNLFALSPEVCPWWIAHVRSRQEKVLTRFLAPLGVGFYLPQTERTRRKNGRVLRSYLPLFPGYVFLRGSHEDRIAALRTRLVVRFIEVIDQPLLTEELLQLRQLQQMNVSLVTCPQFQPGDHVRITEGTFKGYVGTVIRSKGKVKLLVSVSILKRVVAVEFDNEVVVPAKNLPTGVGSRHILPSAKHRA